MELQCKERVDLLEALRQSRIDPKNEEEKPRTGIPFRGRPSVTKKPDTETPQDIAAGWIAEGTIPSVNYPDLSKSTQPPPLPLRPSILQKKGSQSPIERSQSTPQIATIGSSIPYPPPTLPVPPKHISRTPSPEKKSRLLTTLRGTKDGKNPSKSARTNGGRRSGAPAASSKAAGLAWDSTAKSSEQKLGQSLLGQNGSTTTVDSVHHNSLGDISTSRQSSAINSELQGQASRNDGLSRESGTPDVDLLSFQDYPRPNSYHAGQSGINQQNKTGYLSPQPQIASDTHSLNPPTPPAHRTQATESVLTKTRNKSPVRSKGQMDFPSYRNEYQPAPPSAKSIAQFNAAKSGKQSHSTKPATLVMRQRSPQRNTRPSLPSAISRRPVANISSPRSSTRDTNEPSKPDCSESDDDSKTSPGTSRKVPQASRKNDNNHNPDSPIDSSSASANEEQLKQSLSSMPLDERINYVRKHLPKGVDEGAAKQIFNEIVVQGDEVHWEDVAGLDTAKNALKEAVVYPFLRPDLFLGLREPARGMLLFGPPGTGKTMLARAVATESRSTFFAISASSLTSKWLGESEKLVRALFSLAKALAPSIIFVDEIDSLLSSRGGSSEHESTRRIKTEFLIQWSDLQRAAAGKAQTDKEKQEGDPSRVLVLAATNLPWAIDEAARRRFVRRQYIPLPEGHVRATQLRTLLGHQKHGLNKKDIQVLVELTDGKWIIKFALKTGVTMLTYVHLRLLRIRYHGIGQGCGNGASPKPGRGTFVHVHGRDPTDPIRRFRS